ncbi:hypothetical protein [Psychrobacillus antarcticus]|uniref:hypothetical protein n=1 Tax=Psychrobacillus antarcticus TaxID=2879115 RepID=UPI002407AD8D|nr:hypothetical protein [Psychrobacillus antarcticus]
MRDLFLDKGNFTEEEAIEITIQHGYDGAEFKTAVWKTRGCLSPNRTLEALTRKLKTIYDIVEVEGKGKKRKYILNDKKEIVTEREYNYKGTVPTVDDYSMKEYIFNYLIKNGVMGPKTYNRWGDEFGLLQQKMVSVDLLTDAMKELHSGVFFNPNEIISEFINAIKNHNIAIVRNSFNRLEKEGRISQSSVYVFKTIMGHHKEVSKDEYEYAIEYKKELVESLGVDYKHFILSYRSGHKNNEMKEIIKKVDSQMSKKFNIHYMYEMINISIIDKQVKEDIKRVDFDEAYFNKFIKLAMNRQKRNDYKITKSFWRSTYLMNTLKILSLIIKDKSELEQINKLMFEEIKRVSKDGFKDYTVEY